MPDGIVYIFSEKMGKEGSNMKKTDEKLAEKRTAVLMESWADLTEEQRDGFANAIKGLSTWNKIVKEYIKKENEKIA